MTPSTDAQPLSALRAAHLDLLERHRASPRGGVKSPSAANGPAHLKSYAGHDASQGGPALIEETKAFIRQWREAGALLMTRDERWSAQSTLDYWVTALYRAGHEPPDATLVEFDPKRAPELDDRACPYVGLSAFRAGTRRFFFGRQRIIATALEHLREHRLLPVVGPSGSGKSSLVLAGLLPRLQDGALPGSERWRYLPPLVPGPEPLRSLAAMLEKGLGRALEGGSEAEARRLELHRGRLLEVLGEGKGEPAVLFIDQFEELFTLAGERARKAFLDNLTEVLRDPDGEHRILLTLRSDFTSRLAAQPELQALFAGVQLLVTPLDAGELRESIEAPAALVGLKFEEGIVDDLLRDIIGERTALPLLQFLLRRLWESRQRNLVTRQAYERLGGPRAALARSADALYERLIPEEQEEMKRLLLRLVRPGEGWEVTSQRMRRSALSAAGDAGRIERVLEKLVAAGLLRRTVGGVDAEALEPGGEADEQIEVTHEALVRNWPRFVEWLDQERHAMRQRLRLTAAAEQWNERGRVPGGLLSGSLLEEAERYTDLGPIERAFVRESRAAVEQAKEQEQASRAAVEQAKEQEQAAKDRELVQARNLARSRAIVAALLAGLLLGATLATVDAMHREKLAEKARKDAEAAKADALAARDEALRQREAAERAMAEVREATDVAEREKQRLIQYQAAMSGPSSPSEVPTAIEPGKPYELPLWPAGSTLRVRFLDGDPTVWAKVQTVATRWTQYANLRFEFGSSARDAEIRVTFKDPGTWTMPGTEARRVPPGQPTMCFGWLKPETPDAEYQKTVLHEFGHVLGLIHEHQNPASNIPWNKDAVYEHFQSPPNLWSKKVIDTEILGKVNIKGPYRSFDPTSIMMFPIPRELTTSGFEVGVNVDLSESDKQLARALYPFKDERPRAP